MNFSALVDQIRRENPSKKDIIPGFDPSNGNEKAQFLFLLEAPGPQALHRGDQTGMVSLDNSDPSARNLRDQLAEAGIGREEIAIWNIVPWYIGNDSRTAIRAANSNDVNAGKRYLKPLISAMPNLRCIVLVGQVARKTHLDLSHITKARILTCHHTSARGMIKPEATQKNVAIFRNMK